MNTHCRNIYKRTFFKDYVRKILLTLHHHDSNTYYHCCRTAKLALQLADGNWRSSELEILCEAAILHDVGKLMIDKELLNKPEKLTSSEYEVFRQHAKYGKNIVRALGVNEKAAYLIANHHPENKDAASAYSDPMLNALIKADNIDAWLHKRPYKPSFPKEKVVELLHSKFHDDPSNEKAMQVIYTE